jgi:hypothetical protein
MVVLLTAARWKCIVDLLHDLREVRAGVMRWGQQVLCPCDSTENEQQTLMSSFLSKNLLSGENTTTSLKIIDGT